jgi:hypothetical protein
LFVFRRAVLVLLLTVIMGTEGSVPVRAVQDVPPYKDDAVDELLGDLDLTYGLVVSK